MKEEKAKYPGESGLTSSDRAGQWLGVVIDLFSILPTMSARTLKFFIDKAMGHFDDGHK